MQVAFSLIVLFVGGLLVRSFVKLSSVNPGFADVGRVARLLRSRAAHRADATARGAAAGARSACAISQASPPSARPSSTCSAGPGGTTSPVPGTARETIEATMAPVTPGYFETMKIPLLAGRTFVRGDLDSEDPTVVIVNESFAKRYFGGEPAVGRLFDARFGSVARTERGRRRRGGCSLRPAQAAGADDLHAAPARQLPDPVRARGRRCDDDRPQAPRRSACRHAALARDVGHVAGRDGRSYGRARAAARAARRVLCAGRARADSGRVVWRVELCRRAAHARNRHPRRARGADGRRGALSPGGHRQHDADRSRLRRRGRAVRVALCGDDAVRGHGARCLESSRCRSARCCWARSWPPLVPAWRAAHVDPVIALRSE